MRRRPIDGGRPDFRLRIIGGDQFRRPRIAVHDMHHDFAETATDMGGDRLQGMDVRNGAAPDFFPRDRIVIGRARRLGNERREQPVSPRIGSEDMVVPVHRAEISIDIPALTNEFDAGNIVLLCPYFNGASNVMVFPLMVLIRATSKYFGSSIPMPSSMFTWNLDVSPTVMLREPAFVSAVSTVFPGRGIPLVG